MKILEKRRSLTMAILVYSILGSVILLSLFCGFVNSQFGAKTIKKIKNKKEIKQRIKHSEYWQIKDELRLCIKAELLAIKRYNEIKQAINHLQEEEIHSSKEEDNKYKQFELKRLRRSCFYAKGACLNAHEAVEKTKKKLQEIEKNKGRK